MSPRLRGLPGFAGPPRTEQGGCQARLGVARCWWQQCRHVFPSGSCMPSAPCAHPRSPGAVSTGAVRSPSLSRTPTRCSQQLRGGAPPAPCSEEAPEAGEGERRGQGGCRQHFWRQSGSALVKSQKKGGFRQIVGPRLIGRPLSTPSNRLCFPRRLPLCLNIESKIKTCFVLHCLGPGGERGCVCLLHVQQHQVGGSNQVQGAFIRNIFFHRITFTIQHF